MQETWLQSLGWKDSLEKGMATHYGTLAWKILWTEETGRLQSMGFQRVGHNWATNTHIHTNGYVLGGGSFFFFYFGFAVSLLLCRGFSRRRQWHPTPVLLPGKSHGLRSLVGYSPWGCEESDTTERLHFHFSLSCIGEGNGNPLQCSCLENPRDRATWWAAVYGVTQSRTRLKWVSSSSSSRGFSCCRA